MNNTESLGIIAACLFIIGFYVWLFTADLMKDLIRRLRGYPREYIIRLPKEYRGAQILTALLALSNDELTTSFFNYESGVSIEKKSSQERSKLRYSVSLAMARSVSGEAASYGPLAFETSLGSGKFERCTPWIHLKVTTFRELPVWFFEVGDGWDRRVHGVFPKNLEKALVTNLQKA